MQWKNLTRRYCRDHRAACTSLPDYSLVCRQWQGQLSCDPPSYSFFVHNQCNRWIIYILFSSGKLSWKIMKQKHLLCNLLHGLFSSIDTMPSLPKLPWWQLGLLQVSQEETCVLGRCQHTVVRVWGECWMPRQWGWQQQYCLTWYCAVGQMTCCKSLWCSVITGKVHSDTFEAQLWTPTYLYCLLLYISLEA